MASSLTSSPSSSSSGIHHTAENEGEEVENKISDLNQQCQGLGHEVSRLILDNVENNEKLMSLKRRIEEFNQGESQLNREIEQLERKVLMLMLEKGLKDDKLEKFGVEEEIEKCEVLKEKKSEQKFLDLTLEIGESDDKFKDMGIGIEEAKKCEKAEVVTEFGTDLIRPQVNPRELVSEKKELAEKFETMGNVIDEVEWSDGDSENEIKEVNVSDDGEGEEEIGEIGARELCKEIELLEVMLERGSFGLLDLKTMMEEVEALKGPEKMMSEMEVKMGELESGLSELKSAIVELKGKKSKELMGWVTKEEEKELECDGQEGVNARKLNWGSIMASVGAVVLAAAAAVMLFTGRTRKKAAVERGNKQKSG
ncbi:hypothetical protein QQP08_018895 [Theobroma cacao]|nr:hypothetical protein QQP08_018895 [Theobroma cacao]